MSFVKFFRNQLSEAGFEEDPAQLEIALLLEELTPRLIEEEKKRKSHIRRLATFFNWQSNTHIQGLYLHGGVGRGKTYVMDMFHEWIPLRYKQRLHFHRFMQLVHAQLTQLEGTKDPLREIAKSLSEETILLCFDEFYVSDIGDAMILGELLDALFENGIVLIATSNTVPERLYERGLQRQRFLPAIKLIETRTKVVEVGGKTDYRFETLRRNKIFQVSFPVDQETIQKDQQKLTHRVDANQHPLTINGRKLSPLYHTEGIVGFSFHELCETPRSAADYIELATLFHTIVIYDIPQLTDQLQSAARRFIALIDELYDRRVNTLFYAEVDISVLYVGTQLASTFERTASRLLEMQSDEYLTSAHRT